MTARSTFQMIRIAALLAVIFACGILIGRHTAPEPAPVVVTAEPGESRVEFAVRTMSRDFAFDAETQAKFRALMVAMEKELRFHPRGTTGRLNLWRSYLPKVRALIPPDLLPKFDAQTRRTEQRLQRMIRQRDALDREEQSE